MRDWFYCDNALETTVTDQDSEQTKKPGPQSIVLTASPQKVPVAKVVVVPQAAQVKPVPPQEDKVVEASQPRIQVQQVKQVIKKPDMIDRVVLASDQNKNHVKPVVDAFLALLAEALENDEELQLPPLGKIKLQNAKDVGDGVRALTVKIRTPKDD
jgi:hypothetical protein